MRSREKKLILLASGGECVKVTFEKKIHFACFPTPKRPISDFRFYLVPKNHGQIIAKIGLFGDDF